MDLLQLLVIGLFHLNGQSPTDYPRLAAAARTVLIQRHWQESQNPNGMGFELAVATEAAQARALGLKVAVGFECLSADRRRLELPASLAGQTGGFANRAVQEAYLATVRRVSQNVKPDIFLVNIEIDGLDQYDHTQYLAYQGLFPKAARAAKLKSPNTRVSVSIRYMDRNFAGGMDATDRQTFQRYLSNFPTADIVAASTYPLCYLHPVLLPSTFLSDLASMSPKPLFISETGWPSQPFELVPGYIFPASPEAQATYVERLQAMAAPLGSKVVGITYVSLTDPSPEVCAAIVATDPSLAWYCSLSLLDSQRVAKPAYQRIVARLHQPLAVSSH